MPFINEHKSALTKKPDLVILNMSDGVISVDIE